jgi:hypothetical protein
MEGELKGVFALRDHIRKDTIRGVYRERKCTIPGMEIEVHSQAACYQGSYGKESADNSVEHNYVFDRSGL